jgi:DNA-binding NarL/FixJ family response regulator
MTRVAIAAPTPMMRAGLRAMLATDEVQVVGEAASLDEAMAEVPDADVLVAAGAELLEGGGRVLVGESAPAMVVLSDDDRPLAALGALPLRGWGIVSPDASAAELQAAVTAAAQGMIVLPLSLSRRLLGPHPGLQTLNDGPLDEPLTGRELEVLALISQGLSNKLIARSLQISEHTVKFHVSSIYTKLGASSRTEAVSRGVRHGLVTL